ncbi:cell division cycle and apoptosis regulator protein 1 isoform X2 [Lepeophtheirus salmonis]|uniref:cell division cycle and apoptosis regulator protein 1 isoform X2 n=1 Tax=Lepeophtheirus salmonis TaxID=72036 RepID=UPI001AE79BFB|nr:cell division cycle and apoptosis regulator protein 1-like isoform X2 [Lepeophtheirus salmonis]
MAQFSGGGNKQNGPWGRPLDMQPLVAFSNQGVYQQLPPGLAAMGAAVSGGGPTPGSGAAPSASLGMHSQVSATYPRALGPAFGNQQMIQQQAAAAAVASLQQQHQQQQQQQQHGQANQHPPPPDRVLVEANYNANMPFKWNASRIQVMPNNQRSSGGSNGGGVNPTATPNTIAFTSAAIGSINQVSQSQLKGNPSLQQMNQQNKRNSDYIDRSGRSNSHNNSSTLLGDQRMMHNRVNNSPIRGNNSRNLNISGSIEKTCNDHSRDRRGRNEERSRFMDRDIDRNRDKDRGRSPVPSSSRKRSRSPRRTRSRSRTRSPPRRRVRTAPRYNVFVPKISLHFPQSSIIELKKRYGNMYVPSDFFASDHSWMNSFPMDQPLNIHSPAVFHVFNKDVVEPPVVSDAVYDPPDADHTYNVKVMLMASLAPEEFYEKTCLLADNGSRETLIHPTRAIQFLVGLRGKNETMAIGGPWSPSLDGPNPEKDPSVLIKTAIRACRSLTGIDLSQCTHWHRFLEIHYRRLESSSRPARTETTVMFLPDVSSVMPTRIEYEELQALYADTLKAKINPEFKKKLEVHPDNEDKQMESKGEIKTVEKLSTNNDSVHEAEEEPEISKVEHEERTDKSVDNVSNTNNSEEKTAEDEEQIPTISTEEPSSWKDLDPKTMKVNDLRSELNARGLSTKGLKSQLVGRLTKELKQEQEKDDNDSTEKVSHSEILEKPEELSEKEDTPGKDEPEVMEVEQPSVSQPPVIKKREPIKLDEKQKSVLTNAYKLLNNRCIPVHPHPKAKSGKFDCTVMSLSVLLDYRTEDNKEGTFEVSLFAELFNEMLMRDAAFKIYKVIMRAANKKQGSKTEAKDQSSPDASASESKESTGEETPKKKNLDKESLAAFSYFDLGHCGYLDIKDVEDIFYILNINISRSQIKKLISKVSTSKDQIYYRGLLDKLEGEVFSESDEDKEKNLALGFRAFIPSRLLDDTIESQEEGVCVYKGKVVDIGKLLSQLSRSEKSRLETESSLNNVTKSYDELKHASEKFNSIKERLNTEVKDLKRKTRTAEEELKKCQSNSTSYVSTLKDIYYKVGPLINISQKEESGTKEEESNASNGNSLKTSEVVVKNEK